MSDSIYTDEMIRRLERIESALGELLLQRTVKEWYSLKEFATLVGKAEFTVQSWCRMGRIRAEKRNSGRGKYHEWTISHQELVRYQREGLLPPAKYAI